jgi:general secretion pathway protein N
MIRTSAMVLACLTLGGLCLALLNGLGGKVEWAPGSAQPDAAAQPVVTDSSTSEPLEAYAATWRTPLFNPSRLADVAEGPTMQVNDGVLTGIVTTPTLRLALFKQSDGKVLKVPEGQPLSDGWQLEHIESRRVTLIRGSERQTLVLPMVAKVPAPPK